MISRRSLLAGAAASTAGLLIPRRPALAVSGTTIGAIRWDIWYGAGYENGVEADLAPARWHFRAPWFSVENPSLPDTITINGNAQANVDKELQAANAAGLQFWAYDWYPQADGSPQPPGTGHLGGFMNAWQLHQSSAFSGLVKWCILFQGASSPSAMNAMIAQFVLYMKQSNYLKVLSGRPVFMWLGTPDASYAASITALRAACIAASLATPYVIILNGQGNGSGAGSSAITPALAIGADAISAYASFLGFATPTPFTTLSTYMQTEWPLYAANAVAASLTYMPNAMMGDDRRPRYETPPAFASFQPWSNDLNYTTAGTIPERVAQIQSMVNFINANPSACPSKLGLIYSWSECDEGGGCLMPTLGDPPSANAPFMNSVLTSLSGILP